MSDVFDFDATPLNGPHETRAQFSGVGEDMRIGIEVEYPFTVEEDGVVRPINLDEYSRLEREALSRGVLVSKEVTAQMAEVKTDAYALKDFQRLVDEFNVQASGVKAVAADLGFTRHTKPNMQEVVFPELLKQAHPRDRAQVFLTQFLNRGPRDLARYCTTISGFQVSVSYKDEDHGYQLYKRAVFLAPLLATLLSNGEAFTTDDDGQLKRTRKNIPLEQRLAAYGVGNSVAPGFWQTDSASDFFDTVNQHHWDMNMFCVMGPHETEKGKGQLNYVENEADIKPYAKLDDTQRNFTNFNLVSSMQWYLVSLSWLPLPSKDGTPHVKRRIEWRGLDTLPEDLVLATTRFIAALSFDPEFGEKVDGIIAKAGFNLDNPAASRDMWQDSVRAAVKSYDKPYATPYGKVTAGAVAKDVKELCAAYQDKYPELKPLETLLASGKTPAQHRHNKLSAESIVNQVKASWPLRKGLSLF